MLKICHLTLDFPLSYLQIPCLPKGHFCLTGLLQQGSHLTGDGQRRWLKRHSKRSVLGHYLLLTLPGQVLGSKFHLHLSDLCTFQNYWWLATFAVDLLIISSCSKQQERMIRGTKFSLDMYGPEPASTTGKLVPQESKRAEEAGWWKLRSSPENSSWLPKILFFCFVLSLKVQSHRTLGHP